MKPTKFMHFRFQFLFKVYDSCEPCGDWREKPRSFMSLIQYHSVLETERSGRWIRHPREKKRRKEKKITGRDSSFKLAALLMCNFRIPLSPTYPTPLPLTLFPDATQHSTQGSVHSSWKVHAGYFLRIVLSPFCSTAYNLNAGQP